MKKLFVLILMTTVLISCGGGDPSQDNTGQTGPNNVQNTPDDNLRPPEPVGGIPGPPPGPKPPVSYAFDREVFNRERQLWLEQNIQNYSFRQFYRAAITSYGGSGTTVIVKNGDFRYFRNAYDRLYPPDGDGEALRSSWELRISISELYEQIDQLANSGAINTRYLDIKYDGALHFPVYVDYYGDSGFTLDINAYTFVIDPEIPEETSLIFDRGAFTANRDTWAQQGRRNYTFGFGYDKTDKSDKDFYRGTVAVKDGEFESIPGPDFPNNNAQPSGAAQAWIGSIDDVFAKIEAEADAYDGGGLLIAVDYHNAGYPKQIRWLRIFPDSPAENSSCSVRISNITELE